MKRKLKQTMAVFLSVAMVMSGGNAGAVYGAENDGAGAAVAGSESREKKQTEKKESSSAENESGGGKTETDKVGTDGAGTEAADRAGTGDAGTEAADGAGTEAADGTGDDKVGTDENRTENAGTEKTENEQTGEEKGESPETEEGQPETGNVGTGDEATEKGEAPENASKGENSGEGASEEEAAGKEGSGEKESGDKAPKKEETETDEEDSGEESLDQELEDDLTGEKEKEEDSEKNPEETDKKEREEKLLEEEEEMGTVLTAEAGDYLITVSSEEAVFPEDASLEAKQVEDEDTVEELQDMLTDLEGEEAADDQELICFDMAILDRDGNELGLEDEMSSLTVTFEKLVMPLEDKDGTDYQIYQSDRENQELEKKHTAVTDQIAEAQVDNISRVVLRAAAGGEGTSARATTAEVTVTTTDELEAALKADSLTTICIIEDLTIDREIKVTLPAKSQIVKIAENKNLIITKRLNIGGLITFTGAGTVRLTGAGECFRGRMAVGEANKENSVRVIVEETSSVIPNGDVTIRNGATLEIKSPQGINASASGKKITIEEGGTLTGAEGSGIVLAEGAVVTNGNGDAIFSDQGKEFTTVSAVTVGAEGAEAADNQLTAGTYMWDAQKNSFCKPAAEKPDEGVKDAATLKERLEAADTSTIPVAENIEFDLSAKMANGQTVVLDKDVTLTITGEIDSAGKRLVFSGEGTVIVKGTGSLKGRIELGANDQDKIKCFLQDSSSILLGGGLYLRGSGELQMAARSKLGGSKGGQTFSIGSGCKLNGTSGAEIVLLAGDKITGAGGIFGDQGKSFTTADQVIVGAETTPAADNQLTAGSYVWDGTCFSKAKEDLAAKIKELLEDAEKINTIRVEEDITFDQTAQMTKNQILEIAEGKTLTITGNIVTGGTRLTFQGEGTVVIRDAGRVEGRIYVGNEKTENQVRVVLGGSKSMVSASNLEIASGATLEINSPDGLSTSSSTQIRIHSGGRLTSSGNGGIMLATRAKVTDDNSSGIFNDQGKALAVNTQIVVGGSGDAPAENQLTAGTYLWNGVCFFKEEPEPMPATELKNGILILSDQSVNAGSDQGWAWDAEKNILNVNQRLKEVKQIRFLKDEAASMRVNANVTLTSDGKTPVIVAPNNFLFRADNPYTLTINGPVDIGGKAEVINQITLNISGSSPEALLDAEGDILIRGNSVVNVSNSGAGPAISGRGITIREEAEVNVAANGIEAAVRAGSSIGIAGPAASVTVVNNGRGMAVNRALAITDYPDVQISVSTSASGRPGIDYNGADIQNYKYVKVRQAVKLSENPAIEEIEKAASEIQEGDLDAIDAVIAQINRLDDRKKTQLKSETIERLDQMLQKAGVKLIEELDAAPAGVEVNKQIQQAQIYGALIAAGLDTNDFGRTVEFTVKQVETEEEAAATFVCSLTVDGQEVRLGMPVTLRIELPPEYFPLSQDQIHLTRVGSPARSGFSVRTVRAAGEEIDRWIDFTYNGADNTAIFRTDVLGTFSLVRKGSVLRPSGGGSSGGGGGGGGGGSVSVGPGQALTQPMAPAAAKGTWIQDATGWWYQYNDQTYPKDGWFQLEYAGKNEWYYFDPNGYMVTGWVLSEGRWYYLNPVSDGTQGKMLTGWQLIDGKWYYLNENPDGTQGARLADTWIGEYYVDKDGRWDEKRKRS